MAQDVLALMVRGWRRLIPEAAAAPLVAPNVRRKPLTLWPVLADAPGLGRGAHRGPQHGRHDRDEACGAVAAARVLAQHRQRDGGRLAEPAIQLARCQVYVEGAAVGVLVSQRQAMPSAPEQQM